MVFVLVGLKQHQIFICCVDCQLTNTPELDTQLFCLRHDVSLRFLMLRDLNVGELIETIYISRLQRLHVRIVFPFST